MQRVRTSVEQSRIQTQAINSTPKVDSQQLIISSGEFLPDGASTRKIRLTMRPLSGIVRKSNRPPISRQLAKATGGTQSRELAHEAYQTKFRQKSPEVNSDSSFGRTTKARTTKPTIAMPEVYHTYRGDGQLLVSGSDLSVTAKMMKQRP